VADSVKSVFPDFEFGKPLLGNCVTVSLLGHGAVEDGVEDGNLRFVYVQEGGQGQFKLANMILFVCELFSVRPSSEDILTHNIFIKRNYNIFSNRYLLTNQVKLSTKCNSRY